MRLKLKLLIPAVPFVIGAMLSAQTPDAAASGGAMRPPMPDTKNAFSFRSDAGDAAPVKGAPFCATVSVEHTQHLADGNRIHTTDASQLCRDSEGRIRREAGLNLLGVAPGAKASKLITIEDPVAGFRYLLDPDAKVVQKMPLHADKLFITKDGPARGDGEVQHMVIVQSDGGGPVTDKVFVKKTGDYATDGSNSESLGDDTIDGIHAVGTRSSTVIPAGKMGNDKPITITSERWYSPELKVTVLTKHDDPWAGELKTEFKNVTTGEPDASLFTVPADYRIVIEDREGPVRIRLSGPSGPQE